MPLSKHHAFHIIGNGPELKKLMKICSKLENSNIIFWGKTDYEETIGIISRALCTVVPSQIGEAFGLVAAESMALGVPVVSSDIGGLGHLVRSGGGQVVDARDFKQYEHAILKYLNDSDKSKLDGKKGIEYVNQNLSIQSRVDNLIDIYQGL
jgi:glycosyltransferase involved in cell wall biosynthesis